MVRTDHSSALLLNLSFSPFPIMFLRSIWFYILLDALDFFFPEISLTPPPPPPPKKKNHTHTHTLSHDWCTFVSSKSYTFSVPRLPTDVEKQEQDREREGGGGGAVYINREGGRGKTRESARAESIFRGLPFHI